MAARSPRRTFARPFVVTLAAVVPATACHVDSRSGSATTSRDHVATAEPSRAPTGVPAGATPANPVPTTAQATEPEPPPPAPPVQAHTGQRWTVDMEGGACMAQREARCPPGAWCNPPRPTTVPCPPGIAEGGTVIVRQLEGEDTCFVEPAPIDCPPDVICNPPPPQKVDCPQ